MKRKISVLLALILLLSLFTACGEDKTPKYEDFVTASFAECVYYRVGNTDRHLEGKRIVDVVEAENFTGDKTYIILCEYDKDENGNSGLYEIHMHGITGGAITEFTPETYLVGDYRENIILCSAILHYEGDGENGYTYFFPSGEQLTEEQLAEVKSLSDADHETHENLAKDGVVRIDEKTIEAGLKEVKGHTLQGSDYYDLITRINEYNKTHR